MRSPLARRAGGVLLLAAICAWPLLLPSPYYLEVAVMVGINAILALGLNVMIGQTGLFMLGFAGLYSIGAYATAILMVTHHWGFWATLPVAVAAAAVAGLLIGLVTLRLGPIYLAIVTLGFGELVEIATTNLSHLTGGSNGIGPLAAPRLLGFAFRSPASGYYLVLAFAALCYLVARAWDRSQVGRAWRFVREDEQAAAVAGVDVVRFKLISIVAGATFAGVAGPLFAVNLTHITPGNFSFDQSVNVVTMIVVGGVGNPLGAVLGAAVMTVLPELFRGFANYRLLFQGLVLGLFLLFVPTGLLREVRPRYALAADPPAAAAPGALAP